MSAITDRTRARMVRQAPASAACRWLESCEQIAATNLRSTFILWRMWFRSTS